MCLVNPTWFVIFLPRSHMVYIHTVFQLASALSYSTNTFQKHAVFWGTTGRFYPWVWNETWMACDSWRLAFSIPHTSTDSETTHSTSVTWNEYMEDRPRLHHFPSEKRLSGERPQWVYLCCMVKRHACVGFYVTLWNTPNLCFKRSLGVVYKNLIKKYFCSQWNPICFCYFWHLKMRASSAHEIFTGMFLRCF